MTAAADSDRSAAVPAGHPLDVFMRENEAILAVLDKVRQLVQKLPATGTMPDDLVTQLQDAGAELRKIGKHYNRKEGLLFAYLEKYGIVDAARQMWSLDTEIRRRLVRMNQKFQEDRKEASLWRDLVENEVGPLLNLIESMAAAETQGLLPQCRAHLSQQDWSEIHREAARKDDWLVEPGEEYRPAAGARPAAPALNAGPIILPTATLTVAQFAALMDALPADLTFTDEDDRIVFYNDPPDRLFTRVPAIIGRPLVNCHPPHTEAFLDRMMTAFKEGRSNVVENVMEQDGRLVHTRYIAVRDAGGKYAGCLEMAQDITQLRELGRNRKWPRYEEVDHE